MAEGTIVAQRQGHLIRVLEDLIRSGWSIKSIPLNGSVPRNGLPLTLATPGRIVRLRLFTYKVTTSGRGRPHERRVEITTTYESGLIRLAGFTDAVIGVDIETDRYVGVDPRRLRMGGPTHNASSFFDREGLGVERGDLLINPRRASAPPFRSSVELHAFFDRARLADYLLNHREIHAGAYPWKGASGMAGAATHVGRALARSYPTAGVEFVLGFHGDLRHIRRAVPQELVTAADARDFSRLAKRRISPERLRQILAACDELGALGEQAVLEEERRRLRSCGLVAQANRVTRVSLRSVGEGYDILSFENDGRTRRYLEVKATSGSGRVVDVSRGEWAAAKRLGQRYYLVHVTRVRQSPQLCYVRNPVRLEGQGLVSRTATGWKVDLSRAPSSRG